MIQDSLVECSFFVPITRDAVLSDGQPHSVEDSHWLNNEIYARFRGGPTIAPGLYQGFYEDPDTKARIGDRSRRYIVAVNQSQLDELRGLLREACERFAQKCIYLSVAGRVEFIEASSHGSG